MMKDSFLLVSLHSDFVAEVACISNWRQEEREKRPDSFPHTNVSSLVKLLFTFQVFEWTDVKQQLSSDDAGRRRIE